MVSKGRTNFRAMVEDKITALDTLLGMVSTELNKIEESWGNDTVFLDEIRETLYHSIVKELYSLAEKGFAELSNKDKAKWKNEWGEKPKGVSDIEIYYRWLQDDCGGTLPPLKTVWVDFEKFHSIRKQVTHPKRESFDIMRNLTMDFIDNNIEEVKQALLLAEQVILNSKK